ncbi:LPS export ABC transporter periplasmic protein LptC [Desulfurivibrio sp. C05AmB]|jgi:LPS export ABC transporter protein LptC|uniref:LPS export ABC transporter periplasmic protein LptC n=1 Tax=Desulfurivibrio sp. C05AmB TaxID=3374371 RepID=UPI00376ECDA6
MMHGIRNLLWLLPLLLLLTWPLYGGLVRSFLAPPQIRESAIGEREAAPEQLFALEEVRFFQEIAGVRQWRIDSDQMRTGESEDELLLAGVEAFFFRNGREQIHIVADRGRYDAVGEILDLEDNVRLLDQAGFSLATPALSYHEKEGRVSSRAGVEIRTDDIRVRGQNLDYDLVAGRYILTGNVNFVMN